MWEPFLEMAVRDKLHEKLHSETAPLDSTQDLSGRQILFQTQTFWPVNDIHIFSQSFAKLKSHILFFET